MASALRISLGIVLALLPGVARSASVLDNIGKTYPVGPRLEAYREDSVRARMSEAPLHDVEGLWEVAGEGTLMAIERVTLPPVPDGATVYAMVVVRSSALALREGTVMGFLAPGGERRVFDTRIYGSAVPSGTRLTSPSKFTATLSADSNFLSIKPYGRKLSLNWWRLLLPYMYRSLITSSHRDPGAVEGFRRVYPAPVPPISPRYL